MTRAAAGNNELGDLYRHCIGRDHMDDRPGNLVVGTKRQSNPER